MSTVKELSEHELKYKLKIAKGRRSLLHFTELTMPDYKAAGVMKQKDRTFNQEHCVATRYEAGLHHKAIAEALQQSEQGHIKRLMITMPPRHGKSELASRRFPAWFIGRDHLRQVIFATYSHEFGQDFGRTWREIIQSDRYRATFPGVSLKPETRASHRMELVDGGMMVATGVGGAITGRGADLLLIDDPFKNREEAESQTIRDSRWDWFTSTAYTRLMPGGRIVVIMTRWHEDDIAGRLLSDEWMPQHLIDEWTILDLPAIAYENSNKEKALWPEKYPLEVLKHTRDMLGPRDWNALYQQKPTPPEGAFFKRDMIDPYGYTPDQLPPRDQLTNYTSFDLAVSQAKNRYATCCGSGGLDKDDVLWILPEIFWEKRDADESVEFIGQHIIWADPSVIYCEKGQLDKAVGPFLEKYLSEHKIYKYFEKLPTNANKGARATSIRGRMQQGKVRFPKFAHWWPAAFNQLLQFTGSGDDKADDFVDMLAQLGQGLHKQYNAPAAKLVDDEVKTGTLEWVKADSRYRDRTRQLDRSVQGW